MTDLLSDGPRRVAGAAGATNRPVAPYNPAPFDPAEFALTELNRRRARCIRAVQQDPAEREAAEAHVRLWCGIAAWFGAVLPDDLRPYEGWQLWTDHAPRSDTAQQWRTRLATELRSAAQAALTRAEARPAEPTTTRARGLLALDAQLSLAAGMGPIFDHLPQLEHAA